MRLIDADVFKQQIAAYILQNNIVTSKGNAMCDLIDQQPTIDPESLRPQWIPFQLEWDEDYQCEILQGELPEDGQEILVSSDTDTWEDVFMRDGSEYYLDSGYGICSEVTAWMPRPEAYKGESE